MKSSIKYSVCIDALFPGVPLKQALTQVKSLGYDAIEFWSWWDKDLELMQKLCQELAIKVAAFCCDLRCNPGNPADHDAYLNGVKASVEAARKLNCKTLIVQAGFHVPGISFEAHEDALTQVIKDALPVLAENDVTLVVEPLNILVDHPGYHMVTSKHAFSWLEKIKDPHVKILFDIYHQQISEGNILANVKPNIDKIGHFHFASVPGRQAPYLGELNYPLILKYIHDLGYENYFGLEYMPHENAVETLEKAINYLP